MFVKQVPLFVKQVPLYSHKQERRLQISRLPLSSQRFKAYLHCKAHTCNLQRTCIVQHTLAFYSAHLYLRAHLHVTARLHLTARFHCTLYSTLAHTVQTQN